MAEATVQSGAPQKRRSRGLSEKGLAFWMVSPSMALIALVAAYPILYGIWLSLHEYSVSSPVAAVYDKPEVQKAIPFHAELKKGIEQAKARPVSPVYPQISQAIYKNVNQAITGQTSPEDAMKQAQSDIEKALSTF